ncbi:hypothetical protein C2767_13570 [Klebsiella quasipneumoniae]|nr:hypothetical protein DP204_13755 [Klebsiella quasipneumoniae subsp. quasipneumoniae]QEY78590.1 hypothetical protein C2767_13570 [Klebsiella quasipneumoniae]
MNTRATVADPGFCYFPDAQGYRPSILPTLPVVNDSALHRQSASPSDTDMLSLTQKMHRLTLLSRPQNFYFSTYRQTSPIRVPVSACFSANVICSSV